MHQCLYSKCSAPHQKARETEREGETSFTISRLGEYLLSLLQFTSALAYESATLHNGNKGNRVNESQGSSTFRQL